MVKIIIDINEETVKETKTMKATFVDVSVSSKIKNPTKCELKVMKSIQEKIRSNDSVKFSLDEPISIINMCEEKANKEKVENIEKLLKELFK